MGTADTLARLAALYEAEPGLVPTHWEIGYNTDGEMTLEPPDAAWAPMPLAKAGPWFFDLAWGTIAQRLETYGDGYGWFECTTRRTLADPTEGWHWMRRKGMATTDVYADRLEAAIAAAEIAVKEKETPDA